MFKTNNCYEKKVDIYTILIFYTFSNKGYY